jgi:hypothetical protein
MDIERTFDSHVLVVQSMSRLFATSQTNAAHIYVYSSLCQTVHEITAKFRELQTENICFQVFTIMTMDFLTAPVDHKTRGNLY